MPWLPTARSGDPNHGFGMEPFGRENGQDHKDRHDRKLSDEKGWLFAGGCQRLQGRNLEEELGYQYEDIQVEGKHGRDNVGQAPYTVEIKSVARENGERENHQRDDADHQARREMRDRKEKSGH